MDDVESRLWALEREFWLGGADVYRKHLADESLMIFPGMVLTNVKRNGEWKLALHQQSPSEGSRA